MVEKTPWSCCDRQPLWIIGAKIGIVPPPCSLSSTLPEPELPACRTGRAGQSAPQSLPAAPWGLQWWARIGSGETVAFCAVKTLWLSENDPAVWNQGKWDLNLVNICSSSLCVAESSSWEGSTLAGYLLAWRVSSCEPRFISKQAKLPQLCCRSGMSMCPGPREL